MEKIVWRRALAASLGAMAVVLVAATPAWALGELSQGEGAAGCVSAAKKFAAQCAKGKALASLNGVVVSPDGRNAYAVGYDSNSVAVFDRDPLTGALTQKAGKAGCLSEEGTRGCAPARAMDDPRGLAISADGKNVYVAADDAYSVAIFDRDPETGALRQKRGKAGCVSGPGGAEGCATSKSLRKAYAIAVSPDGRGVFVASFGYSGPRGAVRHKGTLSVFRRNPASGTLRAPRGRAACFARDGAGGACRKYAAIPSPDAIAVSPDSKNVYVGSFTASAFGVFSWDPSTSTLRPQRPARACREGGVPNCKRGGLGAASDLTVSPDGKNVYVTDLLGAIGIFDRDPTTGALTQKSGSAGCVSDHGPRGACLEARQLNEASGVAISPDGKSLYVGNYNGPTMAVFDRDPATGLLSQKPGAAGCFTENGTGGCSTGRAFAGGFDLAVSPDGKNLYVSSIHSSGIGVFQRSSAP